MIINCNCDKGFKGTVQNVTRGNLNWEEWDQESNVKLKF